MNDTKENVDERKQPELDKNDFEKQFLYAAKNGHLQRAERLLKDGNYDPSSGDSFILQWACEHSLGQVVQVLLKDKRVDVQCRDNYCIQLVCELGHLIVLKLLLDDGRADPTIQNSLPLWVASQNGHKEVVKALLDDGRVDIHSKIDDMTALEVAVLNEHYEVAQLLLHASKSSSVVQRSMSKKSRGNNQKDAVITDSAGPQHTSGGQKESEVYINVTEEQSESSLPPGDGGDNTKLQSSDSKKDLAGVRKQKSKSFEKIRGSPSLESIAEHEHSKKKLTLEECQKKLLNIVAERKRGTIGAFVIDLKSLQDSADSPLSPCFNQCLQSLLQTSKSAQKAPGRGNCYSYTKELLEYANAYSDLAIDTETITAFRKYYSPFKNIIRNMFNLRNKESPIAMLEAKIKI